MLGNRENAIKMARIFKFVTLIFIVLTLASWAMPMFSYSGDDPEFVRALEEYKAVNKSTVIKVVQEDISLWGFIGFTKNYPQIQVIMGPEYKYINMAVINVPLTMLISGVVSILTLSFKKGIATTIFPLIFSAYGLYGYLTDKFMLLGNFSASRIIQIILVILALITTLASIVFNIIEMRTRPEDYYLPKLGAI